MALAGEESDELLGFCCAAEREFVSRLRNTVTPEMCRETLITASSMLAVSMLGSVKDGGDDIVSYKAGDVEVKRGEVGSKSAGLRSQAELLMHPYMNDDEFSFIGVRG
ncbi:MAG: hypothetical protein IJL71_02170 [Oscillospiraceae bacterium]|nr:hypothetical protein [Oscillospiraceae bacterium]